MRASAVVAALFASAVVALPQGASETSAYEEASYITSAPDSSATTSCSSLDPAAAASYSSADASFWSLISSLANTPAGADCEEMTTSTVG